MGYRPCISCRRGNVEMTFDFTFDLRLWIQAFDELEETKMIAKAVHVRENCYASKTQVVRSIIFILVLSL